MIIFIIFLFSIFFRYLLFCYVTEKLIINKEKILSIKRTKKLKRFEILSSFMTSIIFSISFALLYTLWQREDLIIQHTLSSFQFAEQAMTLMIILLVHDTYYYWLHRAMHVNKKLFKYCHAAHHRSNCPSSYTSFSFDFIEALLQAFILVVIIMTANLHLYTLIIFLSFMSISSIINHLNTEVLPDFIKSFLIGAKHHALHHKEFTTNFGLYFRFWDKLMNTESSHYSNSKYKGK